MKSVLISIQPKWVEKIASGKKTIEVRKTRPNIETPFKCYIYCTNGTQLVDVRKEKIYLDVNKPFLLTNGKSNKVTCSTPPQVNRKVIGEFVCDRIYEIDCANDFRSYRWLLKESCLKTKELENYVAPVWECYGWHITDLKIYDKPKELSEFKAICNKVKHYETESKDFFDHCLHCEYLTEKTSCLDSFACRKFITRPPQSWCYVESLGE